MDQSCDVRDQASQAFVTSSRPFSHNWCMSVRGPKNVKWSSAHAQLVGIVLNQEKSEKICSSPSR